MNKRKVTVKQLQTLTGYLNFLCKVIFPGRAFTRRMYAKHSMLTDKNSPTRLKAYHHMSLDREFRFDCEVWRYFLSGKLGNVVCRPMIDLTGHVTAKQLNFYLDASANSLLGCGAVFDSDWLFVQWEPGFIEHKNPSIEYLELYGVCAAVLTWGHKLKNTRVVVYRNNDSVCKASFYL